jgi:hypothetical protein
VKHDEDFMVMLRREIHRYFSEIYLPARTGLVTSYDPKTHTAKVMLQPEGKETEFLPIHMHHVGANFGMLIGLTPGDGKKTGDQVEVSFQEGDREAGRITARLSSDVLTPPQVQSGEILVKHQKTSNLFFKNDGSVTHTDGHGATLFHDGQGNATHTAKTIHHTANDSTAKIVDTATSGSNTNTRTSDPNAGSIVDTAKQGSNTSTITNSAPSGISLTATQPVSISSATLVGIAAPLVSMAAGSLGGGALASGSVGASALASGAASTNVGTVSGDLSGTLPSPTVNAIHLTNLTVATLPSASVGGQICFVTDSSNTATGQVAAGGGSNHLFVGSESGQWWTIG